jgi:putative glutamine amidotransferase
MTPRIAIPHPTGTDEPYNRLNFTAYAEAVREAGGEAVEFALTLTPAEAMQRAATCDGVLLPGSPADVEPLSYGQNRDEASAPADSARERIDRLLLEDAFRSGKPILGICFGVQMLNVFRGGTLVQDVTMMPVNHSAGRAVAVAHTVSVAPGSLLETLVDRGEVGLVDGVSRLPVNSSHHQAVGIPGDGLWVSARCPQDAVVEALEGVERLGQFVLGVQWHPERTTGQSATSRAIFRRFVAVAASWHWVGDERTADPPSR